jgi:DNA-binding NarL/FixJ family response regulator
VRCGIPLVLEKVAPRSSKNDDSGEVREENMCGRPGFNEAEKRRRTAMRCSSVMIADRRPVVLQGLKNVLGAKSGFKVVACCSDGATCMEAIRSLVPDIAILDISMPGLTGLEILAIANTENLRTRLVFFTESVEDRELVMAAAAGAYGVILKDAAPEILVQSLRQVADGQKLPCWDQAASRDQRNIAIAANVLTVLQTASARSWLWCAKACRIRKLGAGLISPAALSRCTCITSIRSSKSATGQCWRRSLFLKMRSAARTAMLTNIAASHAVPIVQIRRCEPGWTPAWLAQGRRAFLFELQDRCLNELNVTPEIMRVEDGLDVPEAVVGEGCDLRHDRLGKLAGKISSVPRSPHSRRHAEHL